MVICLEEPHLKPIRNTSSEGRIEASPHFRFAVEEARRHNQAILNQLKRRQEWLQFLCYVLGFSGLAGFTLFSPSALVALPPLNALLGLLQTVSQRVMLLEQLIEAFQEEGMKVYSGFSPEEAKQIDFFITFPDKEFILVQNRSLGDAKVVYNANKQALCFRRKGGGLKAWEPDPLIELAVQEKWLRKSKRDLFGGSSRDVRRPLAKLLVLWGESRVGDHEEQMYDTIEGSRFLTIRKAGTAAIVEKSRAIDFIRAYVAHRRSPKALQND
jgi:hypothetical protein